VYRVKKVKILLVKQKLIPNQIIIIEFKGLMEILSDESSVTIFEDEKNYVETKYLNNKLKKYKVLVSLLRNTKEVNKSYKVLLYFILGLFSSMRYGPLLGCGSITCMIYYLKDFTSYTEKIKMAYFFVLLFLEMFHVIPSRVIPFCDICFLFQDRKDHNKVRTMFLTFACLTLINPFLIYNQLIVIKYIENIKLNVKKIFDYVSNENQNLIYHIKKKNS